jgi:hypothetical protein
MNRLNQLEGKLAAEVADIKPSAGLEAALLREFDRRKRRAPGRYWIAAAACVTLAAAFWPRSRPATPPTPQAFHRSAPVAAVNASPPRKFKRRRKAAKPVIDEEPEFVRIPFSPDIAPYERTEIVRMDLPVAALTAAGFNVITSDTSATAQADLLIGEDGMAHAVRLISIRSIQR